MHVPVRLLLLLTGSAAAEPLFRVLAQSPSEAYLSWLNSSLLLGPAARLVAGPPVQLESAESGFRAGDRLLTVPRTMIVTASDIRTELPQLQLLAGGGTELECLAVWLIWQLLGSDGATQFRQHALVPWLQWLRTEQLAARPAQWSEAALQLLPEPVQSKIATLKTDAEHSLRGLLIRMRQRKISILPLDVPAEVLTKAASLLATHTMNVAGIGRVLAPLVYGLAPWYGHQLQIRYSPSSQSLEVEYSSQADWPPQQHFHPETSGTSLSAEALLINYGIVMPPAHHYTELNIGPMGYSAQKQQLVAERGLVSPFRLTKASLSAATNRHHCARHARSRLRKGGIIVLDNSEWYPNTAAYLRDSGLIQVDFAGFKATESHTSVTSVFFDRDFSFQPRTKRQPTLLPGSLDVVTNWDHFHANEFRP